MGKEAVYVGETSRTMKERSGEHLEDAKKEKESSHIWNHQTSVHGEEKMEMKFALIRRCQTALQRQVGETIRLKMIGKIKPGTLILNKKNRV